uniref:DDE_Tnp_1_7 domain-containing protein n=1 Tax=Strongyloides papillosus TaxID=174720 RepID=A0A0N5BH88_STREA
MIKEINLDDANLLDDNSNDVAKPTDIVDTNPVEPTKGSKDKHPNLSDSPLIPSDGKGSKKRGATCPIEEFVQQTYCCLMSSKSFETYPRLVGADKMDKWRNQITPSTHSQDGIPKYINYGVVSKTNSLLKIYTEDPPNYFNSIVLQIPFGSSKPRNSSLGERFEF